MKFLLRILSFEICIHISLTFFSDSSPSIAKATENCNNSTCLCRFSNDLYLEPAVFKLFSCSACYNFIPAPFFVKGSKFIRKGLVLIDPKTNETHLPNITNYSSPIWGSFVSQKAKDLWVKCCEAAEECCEVMTSKFSNISGNSCPKTWDGWHCWPDTPAGVTLVSPCPWHVYFHSEQPLCRRYASKICTEEGTWFRHSGKNEWSNYTTCGQSENIGQLLKSHIISFSISIALLVPALIIFTRYKQLRVIRVKIHKNLFLSLLLNGIFVIIFESYFMQESFENGEDSLIQSNHPGCKVFYTVTKYLRLTTYAWMFCEGFYLHKLITRAFEEQKKMTLFYIIGWGLPSVFVGIWAILRHVYDDEGCWIVPDKHFEWIMFVPMWAALLANAVFLTKILTVLITKLKKSHANEPAQFRRTFKATVVLVPLFGIHFFFVMFHPSSDLSCTDKHVYNIVTYVVDGIQGALVAIIFCYVNHEVIYLLKRSYIKQKLIHSVGSQHSSSKKGARMSPRISITTTMSVVLDPSPRYEKKDPD